MRFFVVFLALLAGSLARDCPSRKSNSKLLCYYSKLTHVDDCYCTHAILPADSDVKAIEGARERLKGVKILVTVNEFNQGLINLLKTNKVDGLEINLKKLDSKDDISEFISTVRSKLGSDLYLALSVPSKADLLAKYYDFKSLSKHADLFILQTAFLGASKNVTFHPSRLSGMWDMQNTDSVVDLVTGLGAPLSKLVISAPVQAFQFTLQNEEYTAPGSPALEVKSITRNELCEIMNGTGNWTLERDEDQAGPYIFSKNQWIAFEDFTSMDIKAKYSRVRGLAGMALKDVSQDGGDKCGASILEAAYNGLSRQARAPRGAVLHSLEREIREASQPLDSVHVSPYRISRVIDVEGKIHTVRQDTRTEFQCSRQGYFVHPRSCNRFYRCVKFDQLVDDFNVFEFDCPAGLAFDERVEVCVWPGSLPHGTPCSGSSEIAPVPRQRFDCPAEQGYYADPENCRWFFACIDHGKSPLTAYEFRCPFGLMFDSERLLCEWPWLVPKCGNGLGVNRASEYVYGGYSGYGNGVLIDQYDGLGALGAVKLGGITGRIEQPVVYSNVGSGLGYNNGGYVNQGGYIVRNGLGSLGYKATQSLQNAGLLKADLGAGAGLGLVYQGQNNIQYSGVGLGNLEAAGQYQYNSGSAGVGQSGQYQYNTGSARTGESGQYEYNSGSAGVESVDAGASGQYQYNSGSAAVGQSGQYQYNTGSAGTGGSGQYQYNSGSAGVESADAGASGQYRYNSALAGTGESGQYQYNSGSAGVESADVGASGQYQYNSGSAAIDSSRQYQYNTGSAAGASGQYDYDNGLKQTIGIGIDGAHSNIAGDYGTRTSGVSTQYVNTGTGINSGIDYNAFGVKSSQIGLHNERGNSNAQEGLNVLQYQINSASNAGQNLEEGYNQGQLDTVQVQGNLGTLQHATDASGIGATSSQSLTQYHGQTGQVLQTGSNAKNNDVNVAVGNSGVNQQGYNSYQGSLESGLGYNTGSIFGSRINEGQAQVDFSQGVDYNLANVGAKSSQTVTQYHGQSLGQGVAGNINIVGGGYSAVGKSKSGIEINGEIVDTNVHSTPSPITVTTFASVPTVTSVPIPALKTASGFESYKGGVVANVPELQYKIQDTAQLANISASFVNFVSTTPSSLLVNQNDYKSQSSGNSATSYSYQSLDTSVNKGGYVYSTPSTIDQGVSISGYAGSSTVRPTVAVVQQAITPTVAIQKNEGYVYSRPSVAFEGPARPVSSYSISSTVKPITFVQQHVHQPAVSIYGRQDFASDGYKYEQPSIAFGIRQQPIVKEIPQVFISSTAAPIVEQKVQVQPAVSTYSFNQNVASGGYDYARPSIAFEERPTVRTISKFSIRKPTVQPVISSTYSIQQPVINQQNVGQPTVATYSYNQDYKSEGYYSKPSIAFDEKPIIKSQPAIVSSYHYQQPAVVPVYQRPTVTSYTYQDVAQKAVGVYQPSAVSTYNYATTSSPTPVVVQQTVRPTVVSSYSYTPTSTNAPAVAVQNVEFGGYNYPKPAVSFAEEPTPVVTSYEQRQPAQEVPFVKKKAYVTGQAQSYQYNQRFESPAAPGIVESYKVPSSTPSAPVVVENYQAKTYSQASDTASSFFSNANVVSSTPVYQQQYYSTPAYLEPVKQVVIQSTPKPNYKAVISSVLAAKIIPTTQAPNFYYYDSRLSSTPETVVDEGYTYPKPKIQFEERPVQPVTYLPPTREYLPVKTSKPISSFSFSSVDAQYKTLSTPRPFTVSTTPLTRKYIPATSKVEVTTAHPVFVVPEISTPAYIPVRAKVRYTTSLPITITQPVREYLPATSTEYLPPVEISSRAPVEVTTLSRDYLPVRSRLRVTSTSVPLVDTEYDSRRPAKVTIIKQNDFHPMLSAKLGAQCTCVSNTLNLRKKQKIIVVEDDDDDDGYVVGNEGGKVVENYQYNPDTVEITPSPQAYVHSTASQTLVQPNPSYGVRRKVRVRPVTYEPVTEAVEVFLKNDIASGDTSDKEIASAVRTGLKLVKQAVKEGTEEALSNHGRANVRNSIDCQRAGLFRHPSQCNKFYACRWDCTKNKFTLHTFNCPVHLTFDNSVGACNWPSQGPACLENTLLPSE